MRGNLFYAIQVIIFVFVFMRYLNGVFRKSYPIGNRFERLSCSIMVSFLVTFFVSAISMSFLESIYFNYLPLFWFINFSMAMCLSRFAISVAVIVSKLLQKLEVVECK